MEKKDVHETEEPIKQPVTAKTEAPTLTEKDKDWQFELYKQLHEQFAVNDNNKTSNVISFLAAIFSVFIGYGFTIYNDKSGEYLIAVTIASQLILLFLCTLCLYFGYSTRRDQFITHEIRKKYMVNLPYTNPFDRKSNFFNFLPDYYAIMYYGCIVFMIAISLCSKNMLSDTKTDKACWEIAACIIVLLLITWFYYDKYKGFKKNKEYNIVCDKSNK